MTRGVDCFTIVRSKYLRRPLPPRAVGGSDARTIVGDDEAALLRLWREKRGEIEPEDLSGNLVVQLGLVTEELNRRWYEADTGQVHEPPRLFGVEPPKPRIEAVRIVDMSASNPWAEFAGLFRSTRQASAQSFVETRFANGRVR